jgi:hypothetical protein
VPSLAAQLPIEDDLVAAREAERGVRYIGARAGRLTKEGGWYVLEKEVRCEGVAVRSAIGRTQRLRNVFSRWRSGAVSTQFSHPLSSRLSTRVLYSLPLDTSGNEREPKLWPKTRFRRQSNAACGSEPLRDLVVIREGGGRDGAKVPELLRERDDANASSIWRSFRQLEFEFELHDQRRGLPAARRALPTCSARSLPKVVLLRSS